MKYLGIQYQYHRCGGFGDRILGLVNTICLAKVFGKSFFIKWDEVGNINAHLDYATHDYYRLNLETKSAVMMDCIDERNAWLLQTFHTDIPSFTERDEDVGILLSNQDAVRFLVSSPHIAFDLDDYTRLVKSTFQAIYLDYLRPKPHILETVQTLLQAKSHTAPLVGIQMRCGDRYIVKDNPHVLIHSDAEIRTILEGIRQTLDADTPVFMTADYVGVYQIAREIFPTVFYYDKKPIHNDMNDPHQTGKGDHPVDTENTDKIIVDHYILSNMVTKLFISGSNFGRMAALINPTSEVYTIREPMKQLDKQTLVSKVQDTHLIPTIPKNIIKFTNIYEECRWGTNGNSEYQGSSGDGSWVSKCQVYITFLKDFIRNHQIRKVIDLGCGDFVAGDIIYRDLDVSYVGYDAYKKLIDYHSRCYDGNKFRFRHIDIVEERHKIESGDLCILKDVLQHIETSEIYTILDDLTRHQKFKYILILNCCNQERDDQDLDHTSCRPLHTNYYPLKKYSPRSHLRYSTKELSIITGAQLFDIVIPVGPNDATVVAKQLEYTRKNVIGYRNIYLVSYDPNLQLEGATTIPETTFPFSLQTVAKYHGVRSRNGWYLQQLIKLYAGKVLPLLDRYLVIDCDTFFLRPTEFFRDGRCLYNYGTENHVEYFYHMKRLDPAFSRVEENKSGICHHMMFESRYVREIMTRVEARHGDDFYKVFLKMVQDFDHSGASEYEIYFNHILSCHRDKIEIRPLRWKNTEELCLDSDLDYISWHWHSRANA